MGTSLTSLVQWLDETLQPTKFRDYCPNGLQVEGKPEVSRLATAVTANQSVLDRAIDWGADALLVHHGYFWKGEAEPVVGMKRRRLAALLGNDVSLLAYHLPLDAHPELGNNARLGQLLGIDSPEPLQPGDPASVGNIGDLHISAEALCQRLEALTGRSPLLIGSAEQQFRRVAWCTGPRSLTSMPRLRWERMRSSAAKYPNRPCIPPARRALPTLLPATMPPSDMACRR